jgi:bifunctional DNA-binding transcriptional regulator/antitoxin component of YhaV-PrlF toxin-antitoxin module
MARECQAQVDKQGRLYLPKATRKALGIQGESANVNLKVEVIEPHDTN